MLSAAGRENLTPQPPLLCLAAKERGSKRGATALCFSPLSIAITLRAQIDHDGDGEGPGVRK
jgi:hypothetical protein